jgi:hypothetical protein
VGSVQQMVPSKMPLFGKSGGLVDDNPQSEFVAAGVTGDIDMLTSFAEQLIGRAVAVSQWPRALPNEDADDYSSRREVHQMKIRQRTMHLEPSNILSFSSGLLVLPYFWRLQ